MDLYYSTAHMLDEHIQKGWQKTDTPRGYILTSTDKMATGSISVWGNPQTACFLDSDVVFHTPLMERYYYKKRGIQITFVEDMNLQYYQCKEDIWDARFGIFCYVNNIPIPWFKRFPPETVQKACTIIVAEDFFHETAITMPEDGWDRAARIINRHEITLPSLAALCRQIKYAQIGDECFPIFFKAKIMEAVSLLLDHVFQTEKKDLYSITQKSRTAAKESLRILNENFAHPPVVEVLASSVGVDKKTLQNAFRQIVGLSIHDYVLSLKMEKALSLLDDKAMRVDEIAKAVGYLSKVNFYKAFKKTYGCTPNEMRKL